MDTKIYVVIKNEGKRINFKVKKVQNENALNFSYAIKRVYCLLTSDPKKKSAILPRLALK